MKLCAIAMALLIGFIAGCSEDNPVLPGGENQPAVHASSDNDIGWNDTRCPNFKLNAKYRDIMSCPGGGGVFIVKLDAEDDFDGDVPLWLDADALLDARLHTAVLNVESDIAEISIRPSLSIVPGIHTVTVHAAPPRSCVAITADMYRTIQLEVEIVNWGAPDPRFAEMKRDVLTDWLVENHPKYSSILSQDWYPYLTYPSILVVEHWTFLSDDWELRICYHVMIPPYDWSMLMLRRRGNWDADIAIKREADGSGYVIHEIPLDEYPTFYGY